MLQLIHPCSTLLHWHRKQESWLRTGSGRCAEPSPTHPCFTASITASEISWRYAVSETLENKLHSTSTHTYAFTQALPVTLTHTLFVPQCLRGLMQVCLTLWGWGKVTSRLHHVPVHLYPEDSFSSDHTTGRILFLHMKGQIYKGGKCTLTLVNTAPALLGLVWTVASVG